MNITEITDAVVAAYDTKQPLMIWGPPGVGKSEGVKEAANILRARFAANDKPARKGVRDLRPSNKGTDNEFQLIDLRLPLLESVDLRGLPTIQGDVTRWIPPTFLPTSGRGILFMDEIVQSSPSMQAAASQLILDRRCGEYVLPDGWMVVGAGNLATHRAAANAMPTHIANRFIHLYAEVSIDAWVAWALKHDIDIRFIAFLKWRSALLHQFDPQSKSHAFASPRSWVAFAKLAVQNLSAGLLHQFGKGAVGEGPAGECIGFLRVFDSMPSVESILLNPTTAPIPTEMSVLYAVTTMLTSRASADNIHKIAPYFARISTEAQRPDFSVMALKEIAEADATRDKKVCNTRAYIEWASSLNSVLV